jgi:hypothetical protein
MRLSGFRGGGMKSDDTGMGELGWVITLRRRLEEVLHPLAGSGGKAKLLEALVEMGDLLARHRAEMPNELVHYLERRSYEKAAKYCAGGFSVHRGKCGTKD